MTQLSFLSKKKPMSLTVKSLIESRSWLTTNLCVYLHPGADCQRCSPCGAWTHARLWQIKFTRLFGFRLIIKLICCSLILIALAFWRTTSRFNRRLQWFRDGSKNWCKTKFAMLTFIELWNIIASRARAIKIINSEISNRKKIFRWCCCLRHDCDCMETKW